MRLPSRATPANSARSTTGGGPAAAAGGSARSARDLVRGAAMVFLTLSPRRRVYGRHLDPEAKTQPDRTHGRRLGRARGENRARPRTQGRRRRPENRARQGRRVEGLVGQAETRGRRMATVCRSRGPSRDPEDAAWRRFAASGRAARSSSACLRAPESELSAPSMRQSSATTSEPSSGSTVASVAPATASFAMRKCRVGERRDLGQVRDADHLPAGAQPAQPLADRPRRLAADAGVDLVEHQRARPAGVGDAHQREHHARELPARGDLAQRAGRHARVGRDRQLDAIAARGAELLAVLDTPPRTRRPASPAGAARREPPRPAAARRPGGRRPARRTARAPPRWPRPARRRCAPGPPPPSGASRALERQRSACSSTAATVPPCLRLRRS